MMTLHLRTDELTSQLAELNSQNADYRKIIHNADNSRSFTNKIRVEVRRKSKFRHIIYNSSSV